MDADAGGLLDDASADLEQTQPECGELGAGERRGPGDGVAQGEHQPVGAGVQDQPELIGERALAGGSVRGELTLVHLDQVLGLATGAVEDFIEMAGLAAERGDDIAGVEAARTRLQPSDDPAFAAPGAGGVGEGGDAAHPVCAGLGPAHSEVVGHLVCESTQRAIAREAEDVVDVVLLAPGHGLCAAVVTVSPEDDPGVRPVPANAADQMLQQGADLRPRWCLARAQEDRHRLAALHMVDVDGQEAARIVVSVEERELPVAVHGIAGVVDIEGDGGGRGGEGAAEEIDQRRRHACHLGARRRVLQAAHGGLGTEVAAALRRLPRGQLEDERGLVSGMIGSLRASLFEELPDFGRHLGYDGKGIESYSTGRIGEGEEHASDPDADWGKHETTGVNGKTGAIWKKVKSWFGYLNRASTASRAAGPIREDLDRAMSGLRTGTNVSTRRFQPGASSAERSRLPGRTWLAHCTGHRDKVRNGSAKPVMFHVSVLAGMWGSLDSGEKTCMNTTSCRRDRIPPPRDSHTSKPSAPCRDSTARPAFQSERGAGEAIRRRTASFHYVDKGFDFHEGPLQGGSAVHFASCWRRER